MKFPECECVDYTLRCYKELEKNKVAETLSWTKLLQEFINPQSSKEDELDEALQIILLSIAIGKLFFLNSVASRELSQEVLLIGEVKRKMRNLWPTQESSFVDRIFDRAV
ncbi:hypothetical protein WN51_11264 [Melipona quadrifasciata]|uniref:Uncharacterized protein n=1 Tax=Melipona quadrifasciata TaxID=166423 RepID=A0A0M9A3Q9_9HYME|nr:hypothetical protein WN51_11264 [Melipona quadrifasciata]